jgi:hypothetical protein
LAVSEFIPRKQSSLFAGDLRGDTMTPSKAARVVRELHDIDWSPAISQRLIGWWHDNTYSGPGDTWEGQTSDRTTYARG